MDTPNLGNWIPDNNVNSLPEPPAWALKKLFDFDHMLVLIPSRVVPIGDKPRYLLTRRAQFSAGLGADTVMENRHPDTWMCMQHSLIPIGPLEWKTKDQTWREADVDGLIAELRSRDTWAVTGGPDGNADALVDRIEADEAAKEAKERAGLKDMFYHLGRDAYRSILARTGSRNKRASDYHGHAKA
jgi:hypothetical protein